MLFCRISSLVCSRECHQLVGLLVRIAFRSWRCSTSRINPSRALASNVTSNSSLSSATRSVHRRSITTVSGRGKQKTVRTNNDTASRAATNDHGFSFFDFNYRSVFYHPVGLPLVAAFHGKILPDLPFYPVKAFPPEIWANEKGNTILSKVYVKDIRETPLTQGLKTEICCTFADQFAVETETRISQDGRNYRGRLDLALLPKSKEGKGSDTPLCVVEVGLSSDDWWKKFDQGKTYLNFMQEQTDGPCCFGKPLLLAIITLDDSSRDFVFQMGVLLCTPTNKEDFRISLIWHKQCFTMDEAAKSFGFLLRILPHFQTQRSLRYEGESEYFSSNCIKAGDVVGGGPAPGSIVYVLGFDNYKNACCCFPFASCTDSFCYRNLSEGSASLRYSLSSFRPKTESLFGSELQRHCWWRYQDSVGNSRSCICGTRKSVGNSGICRGTNRQCCFPRL